MKIVEILVLVVQNYQIKEYASLADLRRNISRLNLKLGAYSADRLTSQQITQYILERKSEGAGNASIRQELAALRRAYTLAIRDGLVKRKPYIELPPPPEKRKGVFSYPEYVQFRDMLRLIPPSQNYDGNVLADILVFGFYSGWRKNEVLSIVWDWVDFQDRLVLIPGRYTKNKRDKVFPLEGECLAMIQSRFDIASGPYVFHRNGKKVVSFYKLWKKSLQQAGLPKKLFHDLRRTAVTNLNRARVSPQVGMQISGHLTDSVYADYNQIRLEDMREAVVRVSQYLSASQMPSVSSMSLKKKEN